MPSHPEEHRPLPVGRKRGEKQRKISKTEQRRQAFQYWVTMFLAVVFIGSTVGVLVLARPMSRGSQADQANAEETRLAGMREQALKNPKDPQWPYEIAQLLEAKGDGAGAVEQYKAALAIDAGYLPALQNLADVLIGEKKYQEAQKYLAEGIAAEKKDIERLNKARGKDDPEVFPDPKIRFLLFDVDMELGPANANEARTALRELLAINPNTFAQLVQGWALKTAIETRDKKRADAGLQMATEEAKAAKETAVVDQLDKVSKMVMSINLNPPSGAPAAGGSGAPASVEIPITAPSGAPAQAPVAAPSEAPVAVPSVNASAAPVTTP